VSPTKPKHPCNWPGCTHLTSLRFCPEHTAKNNRETERARPSSYERLYTHRWHVASKMFLHRHPMCEECLRHGKITPSYCTDHIVPHKGDLELFWNEDNWEALCKSCNSTKAAKEEGGFGNRIREGIGGK
jgi:5-methylcytosine-specific restriction enzyme A